MWENVEAMAERIRRTRPRREKFQDPLNQIGRANRRGDGTFSCFVVKEITTFNLTGTERMRGGASVWDRIS
ncbi:hypothetical protein VNO78_00445 [Psophocarpus tetragonolobus]|uniref:Uncharacterized protein n=1 Tax=Psophocarpus tetragonolobus TaxID=3891 RepID=A0AAN9SYG0_PSOTE